MQSDIESFKQRFAFRKDGAFLVGVERECFVTDMNGTIVPESPKVLSQIAALFAKGDEETFVTTGAFGFELSACQVEARIGPSKLNLLREHLAERDQQLRMAFVECDLRPSHNEVAPDDMPLDVFPDPTGRYAQISAGMPRETLLAACQVIGTHVHIGMPDHDTALRVYNKVIASCNDLCDRGDHSDGRRLAIYRKVAPNCDPKSYESWDDFYYVANAAGFMEDPRRCWTLIRISIHGTIEFRMFGATDSLERIAGWAEYCHALCVEAAKN